MRNKGISQNKDEKQVLNDFTDLHPQARKLIPTEIIAA